MKNLKKVLALVVALTMVLGTVSFAFTDVAEDSDVYTAVQTLSSLSILNGYEDGTFGPEKDITRAEFATVVCRALGLGNPAKGATQFADVPADHWAAGYINLVAGQGIVNGYGDGNFGPEDNVTYEQAVKMLVVALGYEPMAAQKGGYPTGYLVVANTYGLTEGVKAPADAAAANRGIVAQLTYNALDIPMMAQTGFGTNVEYKILDGNNDTEYTTLLTGLDVAKLGGVVTATSIINSADIGTVGYRIDDDFDSEDFSASIVPVTFDVAEGVNADEYFGMASEIYVREYKTNKWEIIAIMPGAESLVVELDRSALQSISTSAGLKYLETEDAKRETTLKLEIAVASDGADTPAIIINNVEGSVQDIRDLGPDAEIKVIENNGNNSYDMIVVKDYDYAIIDSVEADRDRFTTKSFTRFDFDFEDETVVNTLLNKDGEAITLADFAEGDIIAYIQDGVADKWCEIINLGQNVVTGTVTELGSEGKFYIDSVEYELAAEGMEGTSPITVNISDEGSFFLTNTGKVFFVDADASVASNYAYILDMGVQTGGFSDSMQYKLLTKEGEIKIFDVKDSYKVDTNSYAKDVVPAEFTAINSAASSQFKDVATAESRLITYKLDGNGKIREIKTVATDTVGTIGVDSSAKEYKGDSMSIDGKSIAEDAIIFNLVGSELDDAFATTASTLVDESTYVGFVAYNTDGEADIFVITKGQGAIDLTQGFAVVESINEITLNDETAYKVRYYTAADSTLKELTIVDGDAEVVWGSDAADIKDNAKGALIMFAEDGNGVATSYGVIAVAEESKVASDAAYWVNPAAKAAIDAEEDLELVAGYITADNDAIKATSKGVNIKTNAGTFVIKSNTNSYTYNNNFNKPSIDVGDWKSVKTVDKAADGKATFFIAVADGVALTDIITFSTARNIGA